MMLVQLYSNKAIKVPLRRLWKIFHAVSPETI